MTYAGLKKERRCLKNALKAFIYRRPFIKNRDYTTEYQITAQLLDTRLWLTTTDENHIRFYSQDTGLGWLIKRHKTGRILSCFAFKNGSTKVEFEGSPEEITLLIVNTENASLVNQLIVEG